MADKIWLSSPHMSDEGYEMDYIKKHLVPIDSTIRDECG